MNHECHDCDNGSCWTPSRISGVAPTEDSYDLPQLSIDLSCPPSCCDWSRSSDFHMRVGPCDSAVEIEGFWMKGQHPNISVSDIQKQGKRCDNARHDFDTGYPPSVTIVDCSAADPGWCKEGGRTIALIATNRSNSHPNPRYFDPTIYPHAFHASEMGDSCHLENIGRAFIVVVIVIAVAVASCVFLCLLLLPSGLLLKL